MEEEFVVKGALATCQFGVAPAMINVMDNTNVFINGKLAATTMSIGPTFQSPAFGTCNMVPNMPKPCVAAVTKWDSACTDLYINRISNPLTTKSKGTCAMGCPMCISFQTSGQIPIPAIPALEAPKVDQPQQSEMNPMATNEDETEENMTPKVKSVEIWDSMGCQIDEIPDNGIITIVAETEGHNPGDALTFNIPGAGTTTGYVEADGKAYVRNCVLSCLIK